MVLKSDLKKTVSEVLKEHDILDADVVDDLVDRIGPLAEMMDDDEESEDDLDKESAAEG